jgi:hypothetical protein
MMWFSDSALVAAFEKAKKKYMSKVKKLEVQLKVSTERHEAQVRFYFLSALNTPSPPSGFCRCLH